MFKTFIKLAYRNLKKQKMFSIINIFGLAVGLAVFALFAMTAGLKLNADKFHRNAENIYGVVQVLLTEGNEEQHTAYSPTGLRKAIQDEFPEIKDAVRIIPAGKMTIRSGNNSFYENNILFVDANFLTVFTFEMIEGNHNTALSEPNSIVLTEATSQKYFGEEDPLGKILYLNNKKQLTVTGVTKNIPRTSSLQYEFLISIESSELFLGDLNDFKNNNSTTFVLLHDGYNKKLFEDKLPAFTQKYLAGNLAELNRKLYLFPLLDFRLKSRHIESFIRSSHIVGVIITFSLGFILLIIVSINFINLSISRYMYRIKEIGIRKVIGASKTQLIIQFIGESLFLSFLALPIAIYLFDTLHPLLSAYIGSPSFVSVTARESYSLIQYPFLFKYLIITTILIGVISGIYPALVLSNLHLIQALSGNKKIGKKRKLGSKILIVTQFTLSIVFIAFAGIISDQFDNLIVSDFGFDRNNIAAVQVSDLTQSQRDMFINEIGKNSEILSVSAAGDIPIFWFSKQTVLINEQVKESSLEINAYGVDNNFIELVGLNLIRGSSFSKNNDNDNNYIINKAVIKKFQFENPIGQELTLNDKPGTIIGVVEDFVFGDIEFGVDPAVLYYEPEKLNFALIKFASFSSFNPIQEYLKEKYQSLFPNMPFNCVSLEDYFIDNMDFLNKMAFLLNAIGIVAVFFSCLGLLGLTSFMVERRSKEIGIRKVLGVTLFGVVWTIIKEFIILVFIANVLGLLVIYFGWNAILQSGLMFMTQIGPGTYLFVLFISLITAVVAVTSQTLKAALTNSVESLRYE